MFFLKWAEKKIVKNVQSSYCSQSFDQANPSDVLFPQGFHVPHSIAFSWRRFWSLVVNPDEVAGVAGATALEDAVSEPAIFQNSVKKENMQ